MKYVEDLAAEMLATTYGVNFDPDASWDEKRELWEIDNRIVKASLLFKRLVGQERILVYNSFCNRLML